MDVATPKELFLDEKQSAASYVGGGGGRRRGWK